MGTQFSALDAEGFAKDVGEPWEYYSINVRSASRLFGLLERASTFARRASARLDPQYGEWTIPEARRAVLAARARFARIAPELCVDEFTPGALEERLENFAAFVEAAARAGANRIRWS